MRKLAFALAIGLLASAGGLGTAVQRADAAASGAKVVIVVGAVEGMTTSYRTDGDAAAATFSKYTSNIVKVYSPNATWAAVQAAAQGASVLVYLGHGSGYPNPYNKNPVAGDNGMGLNATAANTDYNRQYYGAGYMAQLNLAPNAVVFLNHLCYASGDSEGGRAILDGLTLAMAQTRVDGYASGFLNGNARVVIAEGMGSLSPYIDALFSTHQTIDQMWKTYPGFHNHVTSWASTYNAGYTSQIDPDLDHPQSDGDVYYRSMVSLPGLTTDSVGQDLTTTYAPATYHALTPSRILDTRNGIGLSGPSASHSARAFQVTGAGGVPAGATAVTGNVTVTAQTSAGYLYIGPTSTNNPTSSTLNFPVGDDRANGVTVALSGTGSLSVTFVAPTSGPTAHVIFDVTGYFTPDTSGATYHALTPTRILDSRSGTGLTGAFVSHTARTFAVAGGTSGVPANATAVTGNMTVTGQGSAGYLFIGPIAMDNPTSSTLNFPVGDDRANGVTVALGTGGSLSITFVAPGPGPTAHAIFDVTGYFTADTSGAKYTPLTPTRVLDTRSGTGLSGAFGSHSARTFSVGGVAANTSAVTGNLTVTGQTSLGYLYIGPNATDNPTSSTLNFPLGDDRANGVTVALGSGGVLSVTFVAPTAGPTTQVIFDVTGYFAP
jgi:hypothetical protein